MTPPIRMVSVPLDVATEAVNCMARAYERVHSMPRISDTELANRIGAAKESLRVSLTAAPVREEGGAFKLGESDLFEVADIIRTARGVKHVGSKDYAVADEIVCFVNNHPRNSAAALATREEALAEAGVFHANLMSHEDNEAWRKLDERARPQAREEAQPVAWESCGPNGKWKRDDDAHDPMFRRKAELIGGIKFRPLYTTPTAPEAEKLRVALREIAATAGKYGPDGTSNEPHARAIRIARAALQQEGRPDA